MTEFVKTNVMRLPFSGEYSLWVPHACEIRFILTGPARLEIPGDVDNFICTGCPPDPDPDEE